MRKSSRGKHVCKSHCYIKYLAPRQWISLTGFFLFIFFSFFSILCSWFTMSNTRTIKIILNLRQLDGGGCNTDCGSKSCGGDAAAATCCKEDPQKAIDRARELGRNCGGGGGRCGEEKPTCPPPAKVCPPVMDACPPPAKEACPPPAEACPTPPPPPPPPQEKQSCTAKKAAMEPPKQECPKPPEIKKECPKPPEIKKECPKPPEVKKECPKPPEVKKECPKLYVYTVFAS